MLPSRTTGLPASGPVSGAGSLAAALPSTDGTDLTTPTPGPDACVLPLRAPHRPLSLVRQLPRPPVQTAEQVRQTKSEREVIREVVQLRSQGCPLDYVLASVRKLGKLRALRNGSMTCRFHPSVIIEWLLTLAQPPPGLPRPHPAVQRARNPDRIPHRGRQLACHLPTLPPRLLPSRVTTQLAFLPSPDLCAPIEFRHPGRMQRAASPGPLAALRPQLVSLPPGPHSSRSWDPVAGRKNPAVSFPATTAPPSSSPAHPSVSHCLPRLLPPRPPRLPPRLRPPPRHHVHP